jgi:hypothetical protein
MIAQHPEQRLGDPRVVGKQRADLVTDAAFAQHAIAFEFSRIDVAKRDRARLRDPAAQERLARRKEMPPVIGRKLGEGQCARGTISAATCCLAVG